jgi:hypothetical protein
MNHFEFFQTFVEIFASQGAPPISMTQTANFATCTAGVDDTGAHCRWQIIRTISDCLHLKVNLKEKNFLYVNSTTQRCLNKIIITFLFEDFFHLPLVDSGGAP